MPREGAGWDGGKGEGRQGTHVHVCMYVGAGLLVRKANAGLGDVVSAGAAGRH